MEDVADRYRRLAGRFTEVAESVPHGAWDRASPCEGWTAQQILEHVIETERGFLAGFDRAPALDGEGLRRWASVRKAMQDALDDPDVAGTTYDGYFGPTTLAETVDGFFSPDLVIHAWDIARSTGLQRFEPMPADEVQRLDARFRGMGDVIRASGAFGREIAVPDDASPQDRLLGFLGRQP